MAKSSTVQHSKAQRSLEKYQKRRSFDQSPEPSGKKIKRSGKAPIFVIQKHAASHLHYDFRLEVDGVLVSWAVPKGPSLNPAIKHLAVQTEDHPMEYANFEGVIPAGNYGAGTVMVWDTGTYYSIKEKQGVIVPIEECLRQGRVEVFLEGTKLQGGFALIKTSKDWLMIKMRDEFAHARKNPVNTQTKSALTGRTLHQIKKDGLVWKGR